MENLLGQIYCWFQSFYGQDLSYYLWGYDPGTEAYIIRKTKCFDFWERNVLFPKTKRSFFRTPTLPFSA